MTCINELYLAWMYSINIYLSCKHIFLIIFLSQLYINNVSIKHVSADVLLNLYQPVSSQTKFIHKQLSYPSSLFSLPPPLPPRSASFFVVIISHIPFHLPLFPPPTCIPIVYRLLALCIHFSFLLTWLWLLLRTMNRNLFLSRTIPPFFLSYFIVKKRQQFVCMLLFWS